MHTWPHSAVLKRYNIERNGLIGDVTSHLAGELKLTVEHIEKAKVPSCDLGSFG